MTAAAVIALVGSAGVLLFGSVLMFSAVVSGDPSFAVESVDASTTPLPVYVLMGVALLALSAWGIISAIGLLRLRNWARLSFVVFAAMLMAISSFAALGLLVIIPALALTPSVNPDIEPGATVAIYLLLLPVLAGLAIGIWWLVYFNRARVRSRFGASSGVPHPVT